MGLQQMWLWQPSALTHPLQVLQLLQLSPKVLWPQGLAVMWMGVLGQCWVVCCPLQPSL